MLSNLFILEIDHVGAIKSTYRARHKHFGITNMFYTHCLWNI